MLARVLVGVLIVVGCKGKAEDRADDKAASPAVGSGSSSAAAPPAAKPVAKAAGSGSGSAAAMPPEDPKARAAYRAGMQKGRKATDAKKWSEALAGFDAALVAKPGDPRALGERGFARLLDGKDLAAASKDLDQAARGTKDPKLLSSIWFNRGLIEEKRGNELNATAAFVVANALRPTAVAKAKIAGKAECPVIVSHDEHEVWEHKPIDGADWVALAKATGFDDVEKITSKEEAWEMLTLARTEPQLPATVMPGDSTWKVSYLVVKRGTGLHAVPLGMQQGGRCPGTIAYGVVASDATRILVSGTEEDGGYTFMCRKKGDEDGERFECKEKDDEEDAGAACFGPGAERTDIVFDSTGKTLLVVTQDDGPAAAEVTLVPGGVKISGHGCDRIEPLK